MILQAMVSRKWIITTLLVLTGSLICIRLGIWQLDRLAQRRAFNAHYLEMTQSAPIELKGLPSEDLTGMEYRRVDITGVYDSSNNIVLRNQYHDTQPGYMLLTPLVLHDGTAVLIERGWIPAEGNSTPADWRKYDQPGTITLSGMVRLGQTKPDLGGVPDPELQPGQSRLDFWNLVNLQRIGKQVPYMLLPLFVQPDNDPNNSKPPIAFQPVIEITEGPHMGYALQWFSFSALLLIGYPFFLKRQLVVHSTGMVRKVIE